MEDIAELLACQSAERGRGTLLKDLLDFIVHLLGIALGIGGPLVRDAIELVLGVLYADMGIEPRARSHHHVRRDVQQWRVGAFLAPHVEEYRLYVRAFAHRVSFV